MASTPQNIDNPPCPVAPEPPASVEAAQTPPIAKTGLERFPRILWPALLITALLTPFLGKAVNIDDALFIWAARQIAAHHGADFYGFFVNWYGTSMPMSQVTENPPLASYYMALSGSIFGWNEISLHAAFLLPALMVALGTYKLAEQFVSRPGRATLAGLLTPAFIVSATTLMCDVLMLAFWVWAIFFWITGIKRSENARLLLAGLLVAMAGLSKYFGVALVPLLFVYALAYRRRPGSWLLFLLIPIALLAGYERLTGLLYGEGLIHRAMHYASQHSGEAPFFAKSMVGLSFTGGCLLISVFMLPWLWPRRRWLIFAAAGIAAAVPVFSDTGSDQFALRLAEDNRATLFLHFAILAGAGAAVLAITARHLWEKRDLPATLLALWIAGVFAFAAMINWSVNARSILPMAPALGILLVRWLEHRNPKNWHCLTFAVAANAVCSTLMAKADADFAQANRHQAIEFCREFKGRNKLWFQTHWGFQYYMQENHAAPLDICYSRPAQGEVVVFPDIAREWMSLGDAEHVLKKIEVPCGSWVAINPVSTFRAGFYASVLGPVPFLVGHVPSLTFLALDLNKVVDLPTAMAERDVKVGDALLAEGRLEDGFACYRQALLIRPDDPALLAALAWAMTTRPQAKFRHSDQALPLAIKAARLTALKNPRVLDTLALVYANAGHWTEAIRTAQRALELYQKENKSAEARQIEARLRLFMKRQPYFVED